MRETHCSVGIQRLLWLAIVLLVAGCGGGGAGAPSGPATLTSIAVVPARSAIAIGMEVQLTATGRYSDGTTDDLTGSVTWASSRTDVAGVSAGGLASGISAGATEITARSGTVSGTRTLTVVEPIAGAATVWTFDDPQQRLGAFSGAAELKYRDPARTGWGEQLTQYAKASALGLPLINGEDPDVMAFPATTPGQGYTLTHRSSPNGVFINDGLVSNYTVIMDVLWPEDGTAAYRSLFQVGASNSDDADMFVADVADGALGLGVNGRYNTYAAMAPGAWHRIAVTVQCALGSGGTGQISKFVDGLFVGGQYTPEQTSGASRCRWALGPELQLFTDNDGETANGYVSSVLYVDRLMSPAEITALGGPNAAGASVPGTTAPAPAQIASRRVEIISHRAIGGFSPENTLAGIARSFEAGADHIEADVRVTADGEVVLMHDETVDRTTNGTGLAVNYRLSALKALDAGSWFDPAFAGEQVPTLTETLLAARGKGKLLLDVKSVNVGAAIRRAVDAAGVSQDMIWLSQNQSRSAAANFKANLPNAPILWGAVPSTLDTAAFNDLKGLGVVGFEVEYETATQDFVDAAHANGMIVYVYTVLDPDTMLDMIDLGVDGIETDFPAVLDSLMP